MKVSFTDVNGVRQRYLHEGSGPALLMIHPIGHSADVFVRNIDVLASHFTVIAPDLPGHGFSDPIDFGNKSPQRATAQHFSALLEQLGLNEYSVLGSSYGGLIAALLALEQPARVQAIVIVGSGSVFQPAQRQESVLRAVYANASTAMGNPTLASCRQRIANICYSPEAVAEEIVLIQLTSYALPDRLDAYRQTLESLIAHLGDPQENTCARLTEFKIPALVLTGREDTRADWRVLKEGCRQIPNARFVIFEHCGHLPYLELPVAFNTEVTEFLTELGAAPNSLTST